MAHQDPDIAAAIARMQQNLAGAGFDFTADEVRPRLIMGVAGQEGTGKTTFAFSAPDGQRTYGKKLGLAGAELGVGMLYVGTDVGAEGVIQPYRAAGKIIFPAEHEMVLPLDPPPTGEQIMAYGQAAWARVGKCVDASINSGARTVVVDTGDEIYQWLTLARFGKTEQIPAQYWTIVQTEYLRLMRRAYASDCNLIILHKMKKRYTKATPNSKSDWDGGYEWKGYPDTNYLCQVMVRLTKTLPHAVPYGCIAHCSSPCDGGKHFYGTIEKCRHSTHLEGITLEALPWPDGRPGTMLFSQIAQMVMPGLPDGVWE